MKKIHLIIGLMTLALVGLLGRMYFLQMTDQTSHNARKLDQLRTTVKVEAKRGQICDRHGAILALSTTSPTLWCDPGVVKDPVKEARLLGEIIEMSESEIGEHLSASNRYNVIAR